MSILQPSTSSAKSPEGSAVSDILSTMFSAARSTGGVIKASTSKAEQNELKPAFVAEIERSISNEKTTAATSETTINKYALSGTNSVDSDHKPYETVYDNEQRFLLDANL